MGRYTIRVRNIRKIALSWFIEFGPIVVFFFSFEFLKFVPATIIFVVTTLVTLLLAYHHHEKMALFPLIAGISIVIFGGLTIIFHDPHYLIIKDTIYNGAFGVVMMVGTLSGRLPLKRLFHSLFSIQDRGWEKLSHRWMFFFFFLAITNEYVWRNYTEQEWVHYKVATIVLTILFGLAQIPLARRTRLSDANAWGLKVRHR